MVELGLKVPKSQRTGKKWRATRDIDAEIPEWILRRKTYMHDYVEGYLNGLKATAWLHGRIERPGSSQRRRPVVYGGVKLHFSGLYHNNLLKRAKQVMEYLKTEGIVGSFCREKDDGRELIHYSFDVDRGESLIKLSQKFKIYKATVKAKLNLRIRSKTEYDILIVLQRCRGVQLLAVYLLLEKPRTYEELVKNWPRRYYDGRQIHIVRDALQYLLRKGIVEQIGEVYHYRPARLLQWLIQAYRKEVEIRRKRVEELSAKLLYICPEDHITDQEQCYCGKKCKPTTRWALRRYGSMGRRIEVIKQLEDALSKWR